MLGPVAVIGDSGPVELGGAKPRVVLAVLAAELDRWVSIDRLVDEVWGDDPPASAVNTLQSYLSSLRRGLGGDRLVSGPAGYRLVGEGVIFDAAEFERLIGKTVGEHDPAARRSLLVEALSLWRGDPYQDVADTPTIVAERIRLGERRLVAVERRLAADLDIGEHQRLVSELERLVDQHPLREGLWVQLMVALYRSGRQADALAAYRRLRNLFAQELGIEPGPEIRHIVKQILLQDPSLDLVGPVRQPSESVATRPVSGTVTFLFTDIEESTRLWEEHPHEMAAALAEHDRILTSVIECAGGYLFSSAGDSHAAAFQRAGQAVDVAIQGQLALQDVTVAGLPLPVRMAIHTGEALERDGDYFGPVLNRAGRLRDAAHGRQIVLSQAVEGVIGDGLPDQVGLLDLGKYRLRDLTRPERIYQVVHPHLPAAFPPLRTLEATRNNMPIELTSFVGRDQEIVEIQDLLRRVRLVTLTGTGGCGKTRLALQTAAQMAEESPDGVWLVELAPVSEPDLVASTVARAVGLTESADPVGGLLDFLVSRQTILVVDNCEHLLDPVGRLVTNGLKAAAGLRVLATSREPLGVPGEVVLVVPPLSVPPSDAPERDLLRFDAVRLFQERAEAASPGFRITSANAASVLSICRQLEGIPLAVELATARLRVLTPQEIASRLTESLSVLGTLRGDEVPHHRTLQAALDWSHRLLNPEEQRLFSRLAVFAGGWTLKATEQVCGLDGIDPAEVLDLLSGLVDKSLVVVTDDPHKNPYRLLEPVRQYAHGLLQRKGKEPDVRERHAGYFAGLAEEAFPQLVGPDEVLWLDQLEANLDNLRAALAWHLETGHTQEGQLMVGALYRFWLRTFRHAEVRAWLHPMLDADPTPGQARARALLGLGTVLERRRDGAVYLDEAIDLYRRFGPENELGMALHNRGVKAKFVSDWQLAASLFGEHLEVARRGGHDLAIVASSCNLSEARLELGDLDEAAALADEALRLARGAGSIQWLHEALRAGAAVAISRGDPGTARSMLEEADELSRRPGVRLGNVGDALIALAELSYHEGHIDAADDYLTQHRHLFENLGYGEPESRAGWEHWGLWIRGEVEIARDNHHKGVMIIAAFLQQSEGRVHRPSVQKHLDAALDQARQALREEAFTTAWNEGSAMTLSQALDYALQHPDQ